MKIVKMYTGVVICVILCILSFPGVSFAQGPLPGEAALFTSVTNPNALILLDLSGSMAWRPDGNASYTYGSPSSGCTADTTNCAGSGCSGGFCSSSKSTCNVDCSKIGIARRTIFAILNATNSGTITSADEAALDVGIGYMNYWNCQDSTNTACIKVVKNLGTHYSTIYCANNTSCQVIDGTTCGAQTCVSGANANGGTPLATALKQAKTYLDSYKAQDPSAACRKNFVILITDGDDTFACTSSGSECGGGGYQYPNDNYRYMNRREVVAAAKQLGDAGYQLFTIMLGSSSVVAPYESNTMNWMAYYGGTQNPNVIPSGIPVGGPPPYNLPTGCNASPAVTSACCNITNNPAACYPSGVNGSCYKEAAGNTQTACCFNDGQTYSSSSTPPACNGSTAVQNYEANSNDPGFLSLSGYSFMATDSKTLRQALKSAMNVIRQATYSFTQPSVQAQRTTDENFLYQASFEPIQSAPFWLGHLKKYQINTDGSIGAMQVDAGPVLQQTVDNSSGPPPRNMYTCILCTANPSNLTPFSAANIGTSNLGVSTGTQVTNVIGYVRGDPGTALNPLNPDCTPSSVPCAASSIFKLGDIFKSPPITVGTPNLYFDDIRDQNGAFAKFRNDNPRTSANYNRIIVTGANDGQLHAFRTRDLTEDWSFIPPNMLPKLVNMAHTTDPSSLLHQYFVDGPVSVNDVWLGTGSGTQKQPSDWHTMLIMSEGDGAYPEEWSSSASCDSGWKSTYDANHPYYCGYYALDITNTNSPKFMWHIGGKTGSAIDSTNAPYLGEPYGEMITGRVLINNQEVWVGLIGGGYNGNSCAVGSVCGTSCSDCRGKGFFVISLSTGQILWSYTLSGTPGSQNLQYAIPATAQGIDTDNDGFMDVAYVGDWGGNVWRFTFCTAAQAAQPSGCNTSNWTGSLLFNGSTVPSADQSPIYTAPAVAMDGAGNRWVYWGTGDVENPTVTSGANSQGMLFALKDKDLTSTYYIGNMQNISANTATFNNSLAGQNAGYYIILPNAGEKILGSPVVFNDYVYFTSYVPTGTICDQTGSALLYSIEYISGAGNFGGSRSMNVGTGIPSAPVISQRPGGGGYDLYVSTSGSGGQGSQGSQIGRPFQPTGPWGTQMIYWKDQRVQ